MTSNGNAARVRRSRPRSSSGRVIATTPTSRAVSATHAIGTSDAAVPLDTRPTPKIRAAPIASRALLRASPGATGGVVRERGGVGGPSRASATRSVSPAGTSVPDRSMDDRTTPTAMTARMTPAASVTGSPSQIAMTAATAPSVATIGATIDTLPIWRAAYVRPRPPT